MAPSEAAAGAPQQLTVTALGAQGDGIGHLVDGTTVFLPGILPGETATATIGTAGRAGDITRHDSAPERVAPPCPHFGTCGGCVMQHLDAPAYQHWKQGLVETALIRAGLTLPETIIYSPAAPGERRRMDLALRRDANRLIAGLHRAGAADIVAIPSCLVLAPALLAVRTAIEAMTGLVCLRREGAAVVNLTETGPDILIRTDRAIAPADYPIFARLARATGAPRISWSRGASPPEPVFSEAQPRLTFAGAAIRPPPGAFLQASPRGEQAIIDAVLAGIGTRPKRIVELYAGIGTITFPLATLATVTAYEGSQESVAALSHAAAGRPITARPRDLARQPLAASEFARAGAIVLDPPYAGAPAQMPAIAAASVPLVVYVSCNPASLARDAQILTAAGYQLAALTIIDQFLWSAEIESVAVFSRPRSDRKPDR